MSSPATPFRDKSATLTGATQVLFTDDGFNGCQERFVHNPSATNSIALNPFGNPAVLNGKGSITLAPGAYWSSQHSGAVNVIGTVNDFVTAGER